MLDKEKIFLEYFNKEKLKSEDCIKNYKDRKVIIKKEIDGKVYFIKKYVPYGKREKAIAFGLQKDRAKHYEYISKKLDEIGINHVRAVYSKIKKETFFKRSSILVTEYGGIPLGELAKEYKQNISLFKEFFNIFIKLCKNKIYCTDYNFGGILVNDKRELLLIDFDAYKTKIFLTKKFKKKLIEQLQKMYTHNEMSDELKEFSKSEIKRVIKELNWKDI